MYCSNDKVRVITVDHSDNRAVNSYSTTNALRKKNIYDKQSK